MCPECVLPSAQNVFFKRPGAARAGGVHQVAGRSALLPSSILTVTVGVVATSLWRVDLSLSVYNWPL